MKKILVFTICALSIISCTNFNTKNADTPNILIEKNITVEKPNLLPEEGTICGGNQEILCSLPLFCVFDKDSSVGSGTCQNLIVDKNLDCNDILFKQEKPVKNPVCATIGNQKYTFLNACEAKRRGADTIEKGFCKPKKTTKNNCQAKAFGMGMCYSTNEAWEFDGQQCIQRFITGCNHEIPFETKEQCEQQCN